MKPANSLSLRLLPWGYGVLKVLLDSPQAPSEHPAYYPSTSRQSETRRLLTTEKRDTQERNRARAQLVFGSPLAGPRRNTGLKDQTRLVAGVLIPPKPQEPDNCCMSGCVHCGYADKKNKIIQTPLFCGIVWDIFREDFEEWATASSKAEKALQIQNPSSLAINTSHSVESSESSAIRNSNGEGEKVEIIETMWKGLEDIPIGIRVFMDTEKAIKSKKSYGKRK
ncbi:hypothetical protein H072_5707 [Dactylellina haptotyla CBS 200.50]|uniref:Oxidoreductase-like domain-containing protein n=1 Tax=Dactylellina haptotyla (strain CBS 200.50) TaxID=1284197 RepID=S8BYN2_DACHA|nr:hypothetical protein H072_5707 [Dactylellina haptotyla CBS 200.50]